MELRPEPRTFEQVFESSSAMQLFVDTESQAILDVNDAAAAFYGWPRAAMRAMLLSDLDDDGAHVVSTGERRRVTLHATPVELQARAALHVIVQHDAQHDAPRDDAHAAELARVRKELDTLTRVASRAAHDLNNVLTVMRGAAGFLRDALPTGAPQLDDIGALERATDRAEALARQLFAASRSEAAAPSPASTPSTTAGTAASTRRSGAPATSAVGEPRMALLVEDESIMREIGRRMLESVGYKVVVVQSAPDALAALDATEPPISLVVTDIVLPGMSGVELVDQIAERRPGIAFIAITGYPIATDARASLTARDVPLLVKPFTRDALATAVLRVAGMPA